MEIKKLLKDNIGEHHPVPALIFSSNGDILLTTKDQEVNGFRLMKIYSREQLELLIKAQITEEIENITLPKCGNKHYNAGGYESSC